MVLKFLNKTFLNIVFRVKLSVTQDPIIITTHSVMISLHLLLLVHTFIKKTQPLISLFFIIIFLH